MGEGTPWHADQSHADQSHAHGRGHSTSPRARGLRKLVTMIVEVGDGDCGSWSLYDVEDDADRTTTINSNPKLDPQITG